MQLLTENCFATKLMLVSFCLFFYQIQRVLGEEEG